MHARPDGHDGADVHGLKISLFPSAAIADDERSARLNRSSPVNRTNIGSILCDEVKSTRRHVVV